MGLILRARRSKQAEWASFPTLVGLILERGVDLAPVDPSFPTLVGLIPLELLHLPYRGLSFPTLVGLIR